MFFLGGMTMGYLDPPVKAERGKPPPLLSRRKRIAGWSKHPLTHPRATTLQSAPGFGHGARSA